MQDFVHQQYCRFVLVMITVAIWAPNVRLWVGTVGLRIRNSAACLKSSPAGFVKGAEVLPSCAYPCWRISTNPVRKQEIYLGKRLTPFRILATYNSTFTLAVSRSFDQTLPVETGKVSIGWFLDVCPLRAQRTH